MIIISDPTVDLPPDAALDVMEHELQEFNRKALRNVLPNRRYQETFDIWHNQIRVTVSVGLIGGKACEVFLSALKAGTDVDALARDGAILISLALQHGVSIETLSHSITRKSDGEAHTLVGRVIDKLLQIEKEYI